jgi:hypothetical protein
VVEVEDVVGAHPFDVPSLQLPINQTIHNSAHDGWGGELCSSVRQVITKLMRRSTIAPGFDETDVPASVPTMPE